VTTFPGQPEQEETLAQIRRFLHQQPPHEEEPHPAPPAHTRVLYRVLRNLSATPTDFRSNLARCLAPRGAELTDPTIWTGLSMWDTPGLAERAARRYRGRIGTHLAVVHVPEDDPRVLVRPSLGPGHFTVMACEEIVALFVHEVRPIVGLSA
jgi:hypothetical protein